MQYNQCTICGERAKHTSANCWAGLATPLKDGFHSGGGGGGGHSHDEEEERLAKRELEPVAPIAPVPRPQRPAA
jgi:hypothetical protein